MKWIYLVYDLIQRVKIFFKLLAVLVSGSFPMTRSLESLKTNRLK